jgi:hypothetical protein
MSIITRETITVEEAAKRLGTTPVTYRRGILAGKFPGTAIKGEGDQYIYVIPAPAFERFLTLGRMDAPTTDEQTTA